jgi:hypothetical protein
MASAVLHPTVRVHNGAFAFATAGCDRLLEASVTSSVRIWSSALHPSALLECSSLNAHGYMSPSPQVR